MRISVPISVSEMVRDAVREDRGDRSTCESVVMTTEERVYTSREPKGEPRLPLMFERTTKETRGMYEMDKAPYYGPE